MTDNDVEESRLAQSKILSLNFSGGTQQKQNIKKRTAVVAAEIRTVYLLSTSEKGNRFSHDARWNIRGITKCSSMSIPSSVLIIPAYKEHQHRVSPSHTIQFNLSDHISLTLHILY